MSVFMNADVLVEIFKYLPCKDQLSAIFAHGNFQYVIKNFIWKFAFKNITIIMVHDNYKIWSKQNSMTIPYDLLIKSLEFMNIEKLNLYSAHNVINYKKFENLQELYMNSMELSVIQALCIVNNCPNVVTLKLIDIKNYNHTMFSECIEKAFSKLKLKSFYLKETKHSVYSCIFEQLLTQINTLTEIDFHIDYFRDLNVPDNTVLEVRKWKKICKSLQRPYQLHNSNMDIFKNLITLKLECSNMYRTFVAIEKIINLRKIKHLRLIHIDYSLPSPFIPRVKRLTDNNFISLLWPNLEHLTLSDVYCISMKKLPHQLKTLTVFGINMINNRNFLRYVILKSQIKSFTIVKNSISSSNYDNQNKYSDIFTIQLRINCDFVIDRINIINIVV